MKNLNALEREKFNFLKSQKETNLGEGSFHLNLRFLGVDMTLSLHGSKLEEEQFLLEYLRPYLYSGVQKSRIHVHYVAFRDERRELSHRWWSQRKPRVHFLKTNETQQVLIDRDLVGLISKEKNQYRVWGPVISEWNTDSLDNLLTLILASQIQKSGTFILHASCIVKDEFAYIFYGKSGAGKSTLAQHCLDKWGLSLISSDQCYIQVRDDGSIFAQTTPITFPELERHSPLRVWEAVKVKAVTHLNRNAKKGLYTMKAEESFKKLLEQSLPYLDHHDSGQDLMELISRIVSNQQLIKAELSYQKGESFWSLFENLDS